MNPSDLEAALKERMEYRVAAVSCRNCEHFHNRLCRLNPGFTLPVQEYSSCKHFSKAPEKKGYEIHPVMQP